MLGNWHAEPGANQLHRGVVERVGDHQRAAAVRQHDNAGNAKTQTERTTNATGPGTASMLAP